MFASHHIAKGFAAALMLIPIGSAPALAQVSSAGPIEYLQYDLTPYFDLMVRSSQAYQDWRPNSESKAESIYSGLFDYAPDALMPESPMVEAAPLPYIGYDLTPYYNLAPGCPLNNLSDDLTPICYTHSYNHKIRTITIMMTPM